MPPADDLWNKFVSDAAIGMSWLDLKALAETMDENTTDADVNEAWLMAIQDATYTRNLSRE